MILTVEELQGFITTTESVQGLESKLQALELMIRQYTHNNFQVRGIREEGYIENNVLYCNTDMFKNGDTIQISESQLNEGLVVIKNMETGAIPLTDAYDEGHVLVTKVKYPQDIKMGVVNLMQWELSNRSKVGIQSETISRHSVTYFNMDGDNSIMGYPKSLMGFLKPYMKARF